MKKFGSLTLLMDDIL